MTPELFGPMLEEIKRRAAKAGGAAEFGKSLFENMNMYDTGGLADILFQLMLLGDLAGRAEVEAEGEEDGAESLAAKATVSFTGLPFEEAIAYLKSLTAMSGKEYKDLEERYRAKAFSISGQSNLDLLSGVRDELARAIEDGGSFESFLDGIDEVFDRYGVTKLKRDRADLIFRQNTQTAYQVGRYQQMTKPHIMAARPYWMYESVHDSATRPAHRALDGMVFPAGHEFWRTHYPPNGYKCRCKVRALSKRQVEARGLKVLNELPEDAVDPRTGEILDDLSPDPGFDSNPALAWAA